MVMYYFKRTRGKEYIKYGFSSINEFSYLNVFNVLGYHITLRVLTKHIYCCWGFCNMNNYVGLVA